MATRKPQKHFLEIYIALISVKTQPIHCAQSHNVIDKAELYEPNPCTTISHRAHGAHRERQFNEPLSSELFTYL